MPENYDVALSFAAEDREVAKRIAEALKNRGLRVFFDEFAESELWGQDLYEYLRKIYEESRICIVVFSQHYEQSKWNRLELRNLSAHSAARDSFTVLPVRIPDSPVTPSLKRLGFIDFSESSLQQIVEAVEKRLEDLPGREDRMPVEQYHVIRRDSGWAVKRRSSSRATSVHKTQEEAIEAARQLIVHNKPAELVVHGSDGTIQSREDFKNG